jgi:hypothetical protein
MTCTDEFFGKGSATRRHVSLSHQALVAGINERQG